MKDVWMYACGFIAILVVYFFIAYGMRFLNQATSPSHTFRPEKDIVCVQVSSSDGVALSCVVKP